MERKNRTDRLLDLIALLLRDPGPHRVTETAEHYGISARQLRKDIQDLIQALNDENQKQYIIKEHGKFSGNFSRSVASLSPQVRLYLFLALKQVEPLLQGEGERAFQILFEHACTVLSEQDAKMIKNWSRFYHVGQFGYPKKRHSFYSFLNEIFLAIHFDQSISFTYKEERKEVIPFAMHYAKNNMYLIGAYPGRQDFRQFRLDRMSDLMRNKNRVRHKPKKLAAIHARKERRVKRYLEEMWESERSGTAQTYVFHIYDQKVYDRIAEKAWHPKQNIQPYLKQKGVVGELTISDVANSQELKKWVLGWGASIKVMEPKSFKKEIEEEVKKMRQRYGVLMG
jgi:predicted DNA-binding transcriptional regulator YafY